MFFSFGKTYPRESNGRWKHETKKRRTFFDAGRHGSQTRPLYYFKLYE